ncbi:MAG: CYTH domain-containing protein [Ignavibacteriales bacterium]|jgi:CYTH domain-containing protein|nr:CYTH domain-containing protein [Ignavibacteriaceae bacterium]NLH60736.1 CYTH domain-containing protein [Ignavibacteriales bacterium]HOJ17141.1 CYTH domain-containing protein [Ignavibacteriaceae bacterium]HPO56041.1 CYTH domain-containing protein [Ignavibacteriaceae bacterium]
MGKEIERKFLVKSDAWKKLSTPTFYRQGYLSSVKERTVRVRTVGTKGFLTIKGPTVGITRSEFEYSIPVEDANAMLDNLCERPLIEKNRAVVEYKGLKWELDEFFGDNEGLVIAEVELSDENVKIEIPEWIGDEVSGDPRYFNSNLTKNPFKTW